MCLTKKNLEKQIFVAISIGFTIWSSVFIFQSSFIAINGKRYFCLFDDAMISMRYAHNLSRGLGLVWNSGERIEGYTNLLMTLLMSIATLVFDKVRAAFLIQVLGIIFMLAIATASVRIFDHVSQNSSQQHQALFRALCFFCVLSYYPLVYWSLMGMETGLLTLLFLLAVHSSLAYITNRKTQFLILAAGSLGLAYLTRNDSMIFAGLIWSYMIWELRNKNMDNQSWRRLFGAISIFFSFVILQLAFRYLYYGEGLPNTYTLKLAGMPNLLRIRDGIEFIRPFLWETLIFIALSSIDVIIHFQRRRLLLLLLVFSAIGYQVYVGGDPWNYWRITSPTIPLLVILFLSAIQTILDSTSNRQLSIICISRNSIFSKQLHSRVTIISLTLIALLTANMRFLHEISFLIKPYSSEFNRMNVNTSIVLDWLTTSEASIGVYWAGSIPYFTDRKAIDFLGKSDKYIANLPPDISGTISWNGMHSVPGHNKYDLNYSIATLLPTYVQGFEWGRQDLSEWAQTRYIEVEYGDLKLYLLKDSGAIRWERINSFDWAAED